MAVDPHYANVALLLHCDGPHGSTTFTDSSPRPKTITAHGDAAITTADGRFGGSCLALSGSGGYLHIPADEEWAFGDEDFTIELWVKTSNTKKLHALIHQPLGGEDNDKGFTLELYRQYGEGVLFKVDPDGRGVEGLDSDGVSVYDGAWHHIAVTRSGHMLRVFVDGRKTGQEWSYYEDNEYVAPLDLFIGEPVYLLLPASRFDGCIDELRITKGVARYTGAFTVPTEPFGDGSALEDVTAAAEAPSPLGSACVLAQRYIEATTAACEAPSPLGRASALAFHDFTGLLGDTVTLFVMDLVTPTGSVRVPISSWQATLQTGSSNYVQCVIPACTFWTEALNAATEFVICRRAVLPSGAAIEYEMARAPAGQLQFDRGPRRHTCTLSGYSDAFAASEDPPAVYDRALAGVRSISSGKSYRVRCSVDWLLRPGHRAFVSGVPFVVKFINYYAPSEWDCYMDVGG